MKQIKYQVKLTNNIDIHFARHSIIPKSEIRTTEAEGLIDTGSIGLILPADIVNILGLPINPDRKVKIRDANGGATYRNIAENLKLELIGREAVFNCIVGQSGVPLLLGQIVQTEIDFNLDANTGKLRYRDPDAINMTAY